jgi:hypothetical protein
VDQIISAWDGPLVESAVFATSDAGRIAELINGLCEACLHGGVQEAIFYHSSVGCVTGVRLNDGREVVIKAHQPRWKKEFLAAVARVQLHLADAGFPCARPVLGPEPIGAGHALVEQFVAAPVRVPSAGPR